MSIHHHPSDESILAYANGSLKRTLALALGAHLEGCAYCRESLAVAEELAGGWLEGAPAADVEESALASVLERLEMPLQRAPLRTARPFTQRLQHMGRKHWLAPGIWMHPILKHGSERAYFLGAVAGKILPSHGHRGAEMTQVLQGEFFDAGTRYGPGDFLEAGEETEHALLVGPDGPCVCLIASDGVPRGLAGFLMRLIG
jgi:putative transcriptional regulator